MTKTISKIGNSQGIIFDAAFLDLAHVKVGDKMNVSVHEGGTITLTPVRPRIETRPAAHAARRIIRKNAPLFRRLA
jgi:antitoxin component of MazEF toxin-antitoxin module